MVVVACMCGMASLSSRKRAWVRACICGCRRQGNKYSDAFRSRCGTTSAVLAGGRALGRYATYSHVHTRAATSLNDHLGGRCGVGVVVIKYGTKNDFLYSKQLSGVFQHRLRSPRTYSEGWSISRGSSDSCHLNGRAAPPTTMMRERGDQGDPPTLASFPHHKIK